MQCPACGSEVLESKRFCADCGQPLTAARCPSCGAELLPGKPFCADCGAAVAATPPASSQQSSVTRAPTPSSESKSGTATSLASSEPEIHGQGPTTELRRVSVLFCDLVSFTPLSEDLDPDEVRELLSGYFDFSRAIVSRYGGVIQKFIGDAVMAVWGAPTANEDDSERAVRARLGTRLGRCDIWPRPRAAEPPSTCRDRHSGSSRDDRYPGGRPRSRGPGSTRRHAFRRLRHRDIATWTSALRRATDASIVYADAGLRRLKGKAEPAQLYEALRVVAGVGRTLKSEGLEAPFVGRDKELRLVKDLFHASAEDSSASGVGDRHRWHRKEPPRLGVLQIYGRPLEPVPVAPRTLPLLRRRGRLLGARRNRSGRTRRSWKVKMLPQRPENFMHPSSSTCPIPASNGGLSRGLPI